MDRRPVNQDPVAPGKRLFAKSQLKLRFQSLPSHASSPRVTRACNTLLECWTEFTSSNMGWVWLEVLIGFKESEGHKKNGIVCELRISTGTLCQRAKVTHDSEPLRDRLVALRPGDSLVHFRSWNLMEVDTQIISNLSLQNQKWEDSSLNYGFKGA